MRRSPIRSAGMAHRTERQRGTRTGSWLSWPRRGVARTSTRGQWIASARARAPDPSRCDRLWPRACQHRRCGLRRGLRRGLKCGLGGGLRRCARRVAPAFARDSLLRAAMRVDRRKSAPSSQTAADLRGRDSKTESPWPSRLSARRAAPHGARALASFRWGPARRAPLVSARACGASSASARRWPQGSHDGVDAMSSATPR